MSLRDKGQWADFCFSCDDAAVNYSYPKQSKYDLANYQHYVIMTDYDKPDFETTTQPGKTCESDFEVIRINLLLLISIALFFL